MIPTPILDELQALLEKATPELWDVEIGEAAKVIAPDGGWLCMLNHLRGKHGALGRRDPDEVAATARLIALLRNHAPALIAAARQLEEVRRDAERYRLLRAKGQCHGKVFGGFTIPGTTNRNTLVAFRFWCKAAELDAAIDAQLGDSNGQ